MVTPTRDNVDALILSFARPQWRKVAMILSQVVNASGRPGTDSDCEDIAERIRALVEAGKLEAQGNLSAAQRDQAARITDRACAGCPTPSRCFRSRAINRVLR